MSGKFSLQEGYRVNILDIMALIKDFDVKKVDSGYEIESKQEEIVALVDNKLNVKFYVTGVYNSGSNWAEVNMEELKKLQSVCEYIIKNET